MKVASYYVYVNEDKVQAFEKFCASLGTSIEVNWRDTEDA